MAKPTLEEKLLKLEEKRQAVKKTGVEMEDKAGNAKKAYDEFVKNWGDGKYAMAPSAVRFQIDAAIKFKELARIAQDVVDLKCPQWQSEIDIFRKYTLDPTLKEIKSNGSKYKTEAKLFMDTVPDYVTTSETELNSLKGAALGYIGLVAMAADNSVPIQHVK